MNEKCALKKRIYEADFALYELQLYLDSHPESRKALELTEKFRELRQQLISEYEQNFGNLIFSAADAPSTDRWKWTDGPWPWDIDFMEA